MEVLVKENNKINWLLGIISVAIPLVVALLFYAQRTGNSIGNADVGFLPHLNAVMNSATFLCL